MFNQQIADNFILSLASSTLETYPLPAIYTASDLYTVSANNTDIPVVSYQTKEEYDYAHFSFSDTANITIQVDEPILSYHISPTALGIDGRVNGNSLSFDLSESRYLIIKINQLKELVLIADPIEVQVPASSGVGIYNIAADYMADSTGTIMATEAIQSAIDDASAAGGGVVYVPEGVFMIGNLTLKSNVNLYLQGGAVLRATGNKNDYVTSYRKDSLKMDGTWLIHTEAGSSNISITGRGTIDGNGSYMRMTHSYLNNLIVPLATSHFTIDGIIGRDAGLWSLIPTRSDHVNIMNYKGLQSLLHFEDDAIDIIESQHVLVKHTIAISEDDTYSTKTWETDTDIAVNWPGIPEINDTIVIDDAVAWTHCAAFKLGMGAEQIQQNIVFKNGYVYNSSRALALHHRYGKALIKNIVFENIDIENVKYTRDGPYWLQLFTEEKGRGVGPVNNIVLRNINVRDKGTIASKIMGVKDHIITGVTFENIYMPGSSLPDTTLHGMNITSKGFYTDVTILPVQNREPKFPVNLAFGKPAFGSEGSNDTPRLAFDGSMSTCFGSARDPLIGWVYVDLGESKLINKVKLFWEAAYAKQFQVQISDDALTWTDVYNTTNGQGGAMTIDFATVDARYVRMYGTEKATKYGYSICEFEVYGPEVQLDSIILNETKLDMMAGESEQLTTELHPANTTEKQILWVSSHPDIVAVTETGLVTAKKPDTAVITVKTPTGDEPLI
jgi:polygalacturonase